MRIILSISQHKMSSLSIALAPANSNYWVVSYWVVYPLEAIGDAHRKYNLGFELLNSKLIKLFSKIRYENLVFKHAYKTH